MQVAEIPPVVAASGRIEVRDIPSVDGSILRLWIELHEYGGTIVRTQRFSVGQQIDPVER